MTTVLPRFCYNEFLPPDGVTTPEQALQVLRQIDLIAGSTAQNAANVTQFACSSAQEDDNFSSSGERESKILLHHKILRHNHVI